MSKDITTTQILSTCAHCGETVEYVSDDEGHGVWWSLDDGINGGHCDGGRTVHAVDLSHAFSHMTVEG